MIEDLKEVQDPISIDVDNISSDVTDSVVDAQSSDVISDLNQGTTIDSEDIEHDEDKALDMAYSAKDERDEAAHLRKSKEILVSSEIKDEDEPDDERWRRRDKIRWQERRAKYLDEVAKKAENWAGYLHDNPINESYKEAHKGFDFSPIALAKQETIVEEWEDNIRKIEETLAYAGLGLGTHRQGMPNNIYRDLSWLLQFTSPTSNAMYDGFETGFSYSPSYGNSFGYGADLKPYSVVSDAYGIEPKEGEPDMAPVDLDGKGWIWSQNKEKWQEYNNLLNNPDTTLRQLNAFYIEAFRVGHINPILNFIAPVKSQLEEIRSGRASETPPQ